MTFHLAIRSLATRPVRSAVLACGFGFGIAVMAALLGVGEVVLEQAASPALLGGGDLVVYGASGSLTSARFLRSSLLTAPPLGGRVRVASPSSTAIVYLVAGGAVTRIRARGGIPSLEKAIGDPETSSAPAWADAPGDERWSSPDPGDVLRAMDRFHPIAETPLRQRYQASWAEWLYFNGRTPDGSARFYLTFLVGPRTGSQTGPGTDSGTGAGTGAGRREAGVRLQLEREGKIESFSERAEISEKAVLEAAPDLQIGRSRVRLQGLRYRITLDLDREGGGPGVKGEITLDAVPGRSMPPFAIRGVAGWVSGYVVPVLSGSCGGELRVGPKAVAFDGASGYHDHNWGFWEGVSWQWGQVVHEGLSFVYGRVRPPSDAADPDRIPGFLAVLGPDGPLGFSTDVTIEETDAPGPTGGEPSGIALPAPGQKPRKIRVRAHGEGVDLEMNLAIESAIRTSLGGPPRLERGERSPSSQVRPLQLLQLRAVYRVTGQVGGRKVDFAAPGAAETFRGE